MDKKEFTDIWRDMLGKWSGTTMCRLCNVRYC